MIVANNDESFYKALAYLRFIIFAYAISYYFDIFKIKIIKIWTIIFLIVTFDILFEFYSRKKYFRFFI
jgi:hypothetical protein